MWIDFKEVTVFDPLKTSTSISLAAANAAIGTLQKHYGLTMRTFCRKLLQFEAEL